MTQQLALAAADNFSGESFVRYSSLSPSDIVRSVFTMRFWSPLVVVEADPLTESCPEMSGAEDFDKLNVLLRKSGAGLVHWRQESGESVSPRIQILPDEGGSRINKIAAGLKRSSNLPCEITIDESRLNDVGAFFQLHESGGEIVIDHQTALSINRFPGSEVDYLLPHELRHRFFTHLRAQGVTTPYDGCIDSSLAGKIYDNYFSFEELFCIARDAQRVARIILQSGGEGDWEDLECQLVRGESLAHRILDAMQVIADAFQQNYLMAWKLRKDEWPPLVHFSLGESRGGADEKQTNIAIPMCLSTSNSNGINERSLVQSAVQNSLKFFSRYRDYFVVARASVEKRELAGSGLVYPEVKNSLKPTEDELMRRQSHSGRMQKLYGIAVNRPTSAKTVR